MQVVMRNHETRISRENDLMFRPGSVGRLTLLFFITVLLLSGCATYTPEFRDARGQVQPDSVAEMKEVTLGGVRQTIIIRGANRNNPVLLVIPGGGLSIFPVMSKCNIKNQQFI